MNCWFITKAPCIVLLYSCTLVFLFDLFTCWTHCVCSSNWTFSFLLQQWRMTLLHLVICSSSIIFTINGIKKTNVYISIYFDHVLCLNRCNIFIYPYSSKFCAKILCCPFFYNTDKWTCLYITFFNGKHHLCRLSQTACRRPHPSCCTLSHWHHHPAQ